MTESQKTNHTQEAQALDLEVMSLRTLWLRLLFIGCCSLPPASGGGNRTEPITHDSTQEMWRWSYVSNADGVCSQIPSYSQSCSKLFFVVKMVVKFIRKGIYFSIDWNPLISRKREGEWPTVVFSEHNVLHFLEPDCVVCFTYQHGAVLLPNASLFYLGFLVQI